MYKRGFAYTTEQTVLIAVLSSQVLRRNYIRKATLYFLTERRNRSMFFNIVIIILIILIIMVRYIFYT
ncbi:hypothetical protein Avbf_17856 [Armadillidium vulgare]|nr:hypothetical protein Avbf_17856 [Armadillidium vulgare]